MAASALHALPAVHVQLQAGQLNAWPAPINLVSQVDEIARRPFSIPISCYLKLNFDGLLARIWDMMVSALGTCV